MPRSHDISFQNAIHRSMTENNITRKKGNLWIRTRPQEKGRMGNPHTSKHRCSGASWWQKDSRSLQTHWRWWRSRQEVLWRRRSLLILLRHPCHNKKGSWQGRIPSRSHKEDSTIRDSDEMPYKQRYRQPLHGGKMHQWRLWNTFELQGNWTCLWNGRSSRCCHILLVQGKLKQIRGWRESCLHHERTGL